LIVEEAPARKQRKRELELDRPLHVLALSARNETALQELAGRYVEELGETAEELGEICYTANAGRAHFEQRMAVVGATVEEVRRKLQERKTGVEVQDRGGASAVSSCSPAKVPNIPAWASSCIQTARRFRAGRSSSVKNC
jgi:acyl transferase domain-containing protein